MADRVWNVTLLLRCVPPFRCIALVANALVDSRVSVPIRFERFPTLHHQRTQSACSIFQAVLYPVEQATLMTVQLP